MALSITSLVYEYFNEIGRVDQFFYNVYIVCFFCREVFYRHNSQNIEQWITDGQREFANADAQTTAGLLARNLSVSSMIRARNTFIEIPDIARSLQFTEANNEDVECDIYA
jgi:hypothetical protein